MTLQGYVEKIVFRNEENGYTVLHLSAAKDEWTLVGTFDDVHPGEYMTATGELTNHPVYGEQLNVKSAEIRPPESTEAIERYLGSGAIKGIGAAMAARIVRHFKADTLRIVEEEPERLAEVKGISEKKAREIGQQMEEQKEQRKAMIFLSGYGISNALAIKIYRRYGEDVYDIIRTNPYRLADDIRGVGFKIADDIARRAGILADSDFRVKSGILYTLEQASANGHTCLPMDTLTRNVVRLLNIPFPEEERPLDRYLMDLVIDRKVTIKKERVEAPPVKKISSAGRMTEDRRTTEEFGTHDTMENGERLACCRIGEKSGDISKSGSAELAAYDAGDVLLRNSAGRFWKENVDDRGQDIRDMSAGYSGGRFGAENVDDRGQDTGDVSAGYSGGRFGTENEGDRAQDRAGVQERVYLSSYYYMELNAARMLLDLNTLTAAGRDSQIDREIRQIEAQVGVMLDDLQRQAVKMAVENGVCIVTGGPGTGKTTIINIMIRYFEAQEMDILLAAPTGRAAKRMTEATGHEAKTLHRLLELKTLADDSFDGAAFERNENNPLDADVIIIDEMSMVDIFLIQSLLKAVTVGTRVIFVGDVDQLPSVGPGNVLKDMIESGKFPVAALKKIYRQDDDSDIVVNAHKINDGIPIDLSKRSRDFLFVHRDDANRIISAMITLLKEKIPKYVGADPLEVQVLTPMRRGALGVEGLNKVLQEYLNPPAFTKEEHEVGGVLFRVGDKVMQTKNDYQMQWEVRDSAGRLREEGNGIFNGDMGIITRMNPGEELMEVRFDEDRYVLYSFKDADELELAYAVTIHKSQGSEYPAVILPMLSGPRMLMNRNLLYTAVTRAKKCVCMVGIESTFHEMARNVSEVRRYSGLKLRLEEIAAADGTEFG